ncbi:MAG TPA: SlyX family protein [Gammaproteobacteria bacterium]|nr:SlyX family protein [Gammaproteobacteria bacterium]
MSDNETKILSEKIIELESKLAFQEHTIQELNEVVTLQQTELMLFKNQLKLLHERLESQSESNIVDASKETPPPHY